MPFAGTMAPLPTTCCLTDIDPSDEARKQRQRLTEEEQNEMHRYEEYLLWKRVTPEQIEKNIGISKDYNNFELRSALVEKDVLKANKIKNTLKKILKQIRYK